MKILGLLLVSLFYIKFNVFCVTPNCFPRISSKDYREIVFTFVVSGDDFNPAIQYILTQLACSIPISSNGKVQTFVLDYSDLNWNETVTLHNSSEAIKQLEKPRNLVESANRCDRLGSVIQKFIKSDAIKNHPNVVLLLPKVQIVNPCIVVSSNIVDLDVREVNIDQKVYYAFYHKPAGLVLFDPRNNKAPRHMIQMTQNITASFLGDVVETGRDFEKSNFFTSKMTEILITATIFTIVLLVQIVYVLLAKRELRRLLKKDKSMRTSTPRTPI